MPSDGPATSVRQFVTDYRRVRLAEGFVSTNPEFAHQLPFRDSTGRNAATWRVRARHYLVIRAGLARDSGRSSGARSRRGQRLAGAAAAPRYRVTALDLDAGETGLAALDEPSVARVCGDLEALPIRDAAFDVVIAAASLHYSARHERILAETARVLRRGGRADPRRFAGLLAMPRPATARGSGRSRTTRARAFRTWRAATAG